MSHPPDAIRVAVVGATGYAGAELVRYLARHPGVRLVAVTSEQSAGKPLVDVLPSVRDKVDLRLEAFDPAAIAAQCDVAFTALPQGTSATGVAALLERGCRVVDIGADFRFRDADEYARVYVPHPVPQLVARGRVRADRVLSRGVAGRAAGREPRLLSDGCALWVCSRWLERDLIEPDGIVIDAEIGCHGCRTDGVGRVPVRGGRRQSASIQDRPAPARSRDRAAAAAVRSAQIMR